MNFFVSSYENKKRIYKCNISETGNIAILNSKEMSGYPSYINIYNNEIAVALKKKYNDEKGGICILNRKLEVIKTFYCEDSYTHVYQDDKYIVAASYHEGHILIIDKTSGMKSKVYFENSKIHQVGNIKNGEYFAVDLQNQQIIIYKINHNCKFKKIDQITILNGNQPRHLVAINEYIYILCENTSNILVYRKTKGKYNFIQEIKATNNVKKSLGAAIRNYKNLLFVSNRGDNTISIFKILENGTIEKKQTFKTLGKTPRDFNLFFHSKILLVGNEDTDEIICFKINKKNLLTKRINNLAIPKPVCIEYNSYTIT